MIPLEKQNPVLGDSEAQSSKPQPGLRDQAESLTYEPPKDPGDTDHLADVLGVGNPESIAAWPVCH